MLWFNTRVGRPNSDNNDIIRNFPEALMHAFARYPNEVIAGGCDYDTFLNQISHFFKSDAVRDLLHTQIAICILHLIMHFEFNATNLKWITVSQNKVRTLKCQCLSFATVSFPKQKVVKAKTEWRSASVVLKINRSGVIGINCLCLR